MKYFNHKKRFIGGILLLTCMLYACNDDELNSKELKVYVKTGDKNVVNIQVLHTDLGSAGTNVIKFPLRSTRELLADMTATFTVDQSMVESYNKEHGTGYQAMTSDLYTISNEQLALKAGSMITNDSVQVELKDLPKLTADEGYLLPIKISQISGKDKGVQASSNLNVVYVIVTPSFLFENMDQDATTIDGNSIAKTDWTINASSVYSTYVAKNAIDSNNSTAWFASGTPNVVVDMQRANTIKGFKLCPNYKAFSTIYNPKKIKVEISKNGSTWIGEGSVNLTLPANGSGVDVPDYKYLKFKKPLEMRYFRLSFIEGYQSFTGIGEIDAIN